jgi:hypothetical protein
MITPSKKAAATNKCTSVAGHFDDYTDTLKQYGAHRRMQHDQGFTGSHLTPPSADYSLRIAPVVARATFNKIMVQNEPTLLAVLMAIAMQQYNTAKHHHRVSTRSNSII